MGATPERHALGARCERIQAREVARWKGKCAGGFVRIYTVWHGAAGVYWGAVFEGGAELFAGGIFWKV